MKTVKANIIESADGRKDLLDTLMYGSYVANRGYGMTHEALVRHGIGNDAMKAKYEQETKNN